MVTALLTSAASEAQVRLGKIAQFAIGYVHEKKMPSHPGEHFGVVLYRAYRVRPSGTGVRAFTVRKSSELLRTLSRLQPDRRLRGDQLNVREAYQPPARDLAI